METIFLAIAICFDAACVDQQIFIAEQFPSNGRAICETSAKQRAAMLQAADMTGWRVGCRTQSELESEGV